MAGAVPKSDKACIIGAGPAGLAAARALDAHGIDHDIYERHSAIGGIWDRTNPGTPMYESAHFISSKTMSHFRDFPMPPDYPDYPSNEQIRDYVRSFADAFGLRQKVRFNTEVQSAVRNADGWTVTFGDGSSRDYRWLICANGTNWIPNMPPATGSFHGEIMHSVAYKSVRQLEGKSVLVIGAGNSGCDIACDAAKMARKAYISVRRGYHFIPKHVFGKPADVFAAGGPPMPVWLAQHIFGWLLRLLNGDVTRYGLPRPDHKLFESHPILNSQLLHYLGHGDIAVKPDVERFEGKDVVFKDGSRIEADLVIFATGYHWAFPFLDRDHLSWTNGRPDLFLGVFNPMEPTIYCMGFLETNGGVYKLFDETADLAARAIQADRDDPRTFDRVRSMVVADGYDTSGGVHYVATERHANYANIDSYRAAVKRFRRAMSWPVPTDGNFKAHRPAGEQKPELLQTGRR